MPSIELPPRLDTSTVFEFAEALMNIEASEMRFDFRPLAFAKPFATLIAAAEIRRCVQAHPETRFSADNIGGLNRCHDYLKHVGFFQHCGFDTGRMPGEAKGGESYVPITVVRRTDLRLSNAQGAIPVGQAIQTKAEELATVLTGRHVGLVNRPIAYYIRETMRNVFEHSGSSECECFAQYYPAKEEVHLALLDHGCGVFAALQQRHHPSSPAEALRLAIKPGISGKEIHEDSDEWANSGYGLFVLSELGRRTGSFRLCSGGELLEISKSGGERWVPAGLLPGTAVELIIERPKGVNMESFIQGIISEAEKGRTRASKSTKAF